MISLSKGERYWNIGIGLFSVFMVGLFFNFDYFNRIDPPLVYFTFVKHPLAAIFFLGSFFIAFRHSFMLVRFVVSHAKHIIRYVIIVLSVCLLIGIVLTYKSILMVFTNISSPYEWYTVIVLVLFADFWMVAIYFMLMKSKKK